MPMEIQIYLAKFVPDVRRGEPRNIGVVVRTASDELVHKFLLDGEQTQSIPQWLDVSEYLGVTRKWREAMDKYGPKSLAWTGKRKNPGQQYYLEFMGAELNPNFDLDVLFKELVL